MGIIEPMVNGEQGPLIQRNGLVYGVFWSWHGVGQGKFALSAGEPNGPSFAKGVFTIHNEVNGPWVEWQWPKGQSRWRPDRDEDELD